jgi:DNA adenine methylase
VFFAVAPEKAILGDLIDPIITMYQMVRDEPEIVAEAIQGLLKFGLTEEVFLRVRAWEPADPRAVAARVIYLNKTAFNGLWRTNRAGKINSPWGKYTDPKFPTISDLQRASDVLRGATLVCQDWSDTISTASCGDCIFVDPPYPGTFDSYAGNVTTSIVPELAKKLRRKYEEGVGVVATIPDTPDIRALFEGWCEAVPIPRNSPVSCDSTTRTAIDQVAWASKLEER